MMQLHFCEELVAVLVVEGCLHLVIERQGALAFHHDVLISN